MGEFNKAKAILEESIEIYKQIRPEDHPDIGRNILNLGITHGELKDNIKAKELLEKSLNNYEHNYGKSHIEVGKVVNSKVKMYHNLNAKMYHLHVNKVPCCVSIN